MAAHVRDRRDRGRFGQRVIERRESAAIGETRCRTHALGIHRQRHRATSVGNERDARRRDRARNCCISSGPRAIGAIGPSSIATPQFTRIRASRHTAAAGAPRRLDDDGIADPRRPSARALIARRDHARSRGGDACAGEPTAEGGSCRPLGAPPTRTVQAGLSPDARCARRAARGSDWSRARPATRRRRRRRGIDRRTPDGFRRRDDGTRSTPCGDWTGEPRVGRQPRSRGHRSPPDPRRARSASPGLRAPASAAPAGPRARRRSRTRAQDAHEGMVALGLVIGRFNSLSTIRRH